MSIFHGFLRASELLYSTWWWLMVFLFVATVICAVLIAKSDCDLVLALYSVLGAKYPKALQGKVIWVTGASSGIGENLCYVLARAGAILILSARRKEELQRVMERCKELSPEKFMDRHMVLPMDLTDTSKHADLVAKVIKKYTRIDYLVNNAGRSQRAEAAATDLEVDRAIMDLNTLSTISLTKAVLPEMIACRDGCVVIMSSVAGKIGAPGSASYSASKHALQGYFDTVRMELADRNISFLSICPGPVDTPFIHNLFTEKLTSSLKDTQPRRAGGDRVSAERCAELSAVAMANRLDEVWISKQPILFFVYMKQYFPNVANWVGKRVGNKRLQAMKAGRTEVDGSYFK